MCPLSPKVLKGQLLKGKLELSYLNFSTDADITLAAKPTTNLLPIHLTGNVNDGTVNLINQTLLSVFDNQARDAGIAVTAGLFHLINEVVQAEAAVSNSGVDDSDASVINNANLVVESLIGLLYGEQIVQQAATLFSNLGQYTFEELSFGVDWTPFLSGSVEAIKILSATGKADLDIGLDVSVQGKNNQLIYDLGHTAAEQASFSAKVLFWSWYWSAGWQQTATLPPLDASTVSNLGSSETASTTEGSNGSVAVSYNPTAGSNTLYSDSSIETPTQGT